MRLIGISLLAALALHGSPAAAAPLPVGRDGVFGLADVLECYGAARRLPEHPHRAACDDDADGRIGIAEALMWYAIYRHVAPRILGADVASAPPGAVITLRIGDVAAGDPALVVEMEAIEGGRAALGHRADVSGGLVVALPADAPPGLAHLRLRRGAFPSNRFPIDVCSPDPAGGGCAARPECEPDPPACLPPPPGAFDVTAGATTASSARYRARLVVGGQPGVGVSESPGYRARLRVRTVGRGGNP